MTEIELLTERVKQLEQHRFELTEDQLNGLAERAAAKALENIYAQVGKGVLRKLAWLIGIVVLSLAAFLVGKGAIVLPGNGQ